MLGTMNREGIREDDRNYSYSPDRTVPSFDARLGRDQDLYNIYAPAAAVTQRPAARAQQPTYAPDPMREEVLWNKLNNNTVSRNDAMNYNMNVSPFEAKMAYMPGNDQIFEPVKLRESQPRLAQPVRRRPANKGLSTQGKVILAVYMAVVLLIVTLVIVNAQLINKAPETEAPAAGITNAYEVNDKGLSFVESPYNNTAAQTNWFDKLADKIGE